MWFWKRVNLPKSILGEQRMVDKVINNLLKYPRWNNEQMGNKSKRMHMRTKAVLGCFLVGIIIVTCGFLEHKSPPPPSGIKFVAAADVVKSNLERSVTISAEMRPYMEVDLHAKVAGYLKSLSVDIGDQVKAGEVIAKIDTPELEADLNNTTAAYQDAKLNYDRLYQVSQKQPGLLAQQDIDNAQASYEIAKANMERARTFMDYATISVPFNGVVTKRYADPGALIQTSDSNARQTMPVVRIAENDRLRLDFPVPEPDVPFIKVGMPIQVTVSATGQKIMGHVARATDMVDPDTRTMETEVDVDNQDLRLTPGMYAYVNLPLETRKNVLTLPIEAVSLNGDPNVWKITNNDEIQQQPVTIGLQTPNRIQILSGLKEGDSVVYGSREMVNIGMKVKPKLVGES